MNWQWLIALQILDEKEITNVRRTIGRMALTGVGVSLFSKGRNGGLGAGLLDLSARGAEKKVIVNGLLCFRDSTLFTFSLVESDFDNMMRFVPPHAFSDEAVEQANNFYHLIERMKLDGQRALDELAGDFDQSHNEALRLTAEVETGATFSERDQARSKAQAMTNEVEAKKHLLVAVLHALAIEPRDFIRRMAHRPALETIFSIAERQVKPVPTSDAALHQSAPVEHESRIRRTPPAQRLKVFAIAAGIVVVAIWLLARCAG